MCVLVKFMYWNMNGLIGWLLLVIVVCEMKLW